MELQYLSDTGGNKTAVLIPIEEWNSLKKKYPEIDKLEGELPEWQKQILGQRKHLVNDTSQHISFEDFLKELEEEDEEA